MNPILDTQNLPRHVAIIMDGNGRWAEQRQLHRLEGHRKGVETVDEIVTHACNLGVEYLTLYAFSQENWERPSEEVMGLMDLLQYFLKAKREKLINNGVRLRAIGQLDLLKEPILKELTQAMEATQHCQKLTLTLCLSYGSRFELIDTMNLMLRRAFAEGNVAKQITAEDFSSQLYTHYMPDPDLLIRTSGEYRISNFLLWQLAYAELYFTETLWPDFTSQEFDDALAEFQRRERRFGKTSKQIRQGESL